MIYPTAEQAINCLIVCQMLSNYYRDIQLFRFNDQTGEVFILAGDDLQIIVPPNEPWRFVDEAEFYRNERTRIKSLCAGTSGR